MANENVIEAFLSRQPAGNGALFTLDGKLVSYQLPIANYGKAGIRVLAKTRCVKPDGSVSRTTLKHRGILLRAAEMRGIVVDEVDSL